MRLSGDDDTGVLAADGDADCLAGWHGLHPADRAGQPPAVIVGGKSSAGVKVKA